MELNVKAIKKGIAPKNAKTDPRIHRLNFSECINCLRAVKLDNPIFCNTKPIDWIEMPITPINIGKICCIEILP
jgi:hypothetical protein